MVGVSSLALFSMMLTRKLEPSPPSSSVVTLRAFNFHHILIFAPPSVILIRALVIFDARLHFFAVVFRFESVSVAE